MDTKDATNKPKFDVKQYSSNYVMHCNTKEKAKIFCNYLDKCGYEWVTGQEYSRTNWDVYKESTVYYFINGYFGKYEYVYSEDTILEFDDFDWSMPSVKELQNEFLNMLYKE